MRILWIGVGGVDYSLRSRQIYQQLLLLSKKNNVTLVVKKNSRVAREIRDSVETIYFVSEYLSPLFSFLIYLKGHLFSKYDAVYTKLTFSILSGFLIKLFFRRAYWVANLNDHPEAVLIPNKLSLRYIKFKLFIMLLKRFRILSLVDLAITVGSQMDHGLPNIFASEYHVQREKMLLVENGVDLSVFKRTKDEPDERPFRMVFVGHLSPHFGIDTLMMAMTYLKKQVAEIELIMIGIASQKEIDFVKYRAMEYKVIEYIKLPGVVKSENLPAILQKCHIGIYPFLKTHDLDCVFPVKVYNYLAMELPVVASNLYGVSQIVKHGYNGLLVEPDDPQDLARALIELSNDKDLYNRLKENTRKSVLKNDWKRIIKKIMVKLEDEIRGSTVYESNH